MKVCPGCAKEVETVARVCDSCGSQLAELRPFDPAYWVERFDYSFADATDMAAKEPRYWIHYSGMTSAAAATAARRHRRRLEETDTDAPASEGVLPRGSVDESDRARARRKTEAVLMAAEISNYPANARRSHKGLFLVSPLAWAIRKTWDGKPR
jgi:hypothetical protein